ncbi:single-stranded DNA-binding protein [Mesorhizobium muleiense]|uniref:Single-stranded DNA-binding protein n=1 Tax=Mesorhizobium muleiense TaxID=1004279 RepID=A0A1G8LEE0_9HYPH|nr:single-stranded DNA-binding protein [Mesorhizobium muleiense]MCF6100353.1 single-stranded DNA-binding protein [Mesorhizobium muleiense]SDI53600.1 Single-stranded DNA-binding protein [Mesorhizobium muleiense]
MFHASVYGRIGQDPVQRTSAAGNTWATASIACDIASEGGPPLWLSIVAFGKIAELLLRHDKGDLLSISGKLQVNRWRDRDGNQREQLQIIADTVISARTVRPAGGRKRQQPREEQQLNLA